MRYKQKHKRFGIYKSGLEQMVAKVLGKRAEYEPIRLAYLIPKHYKPDFIIKKKNGKEIVLEVKGYLRWQDQQKMRAVKACNPELDIRFYFPKDGKVQTSGMLNSEWCEKYSFDYAIGKIPKSWLQ